MNIRPLTENLYTTLSAEELEERLEMAEAACVSLECSHNQPSGPGPKPEPIHPTGCGINQG